MSKIPEQTPVLKPQITSRRRGKELDNAILLTTWNELEKIGYNKLTMDLVAQKAGTSKAVLYRRWDNKFQLVRTAMKKHMPKIPEIKTPSTGSLRTDILKLISDLIKPMSIINTDTRRGLIAELISENPDAIPDIQAQDSKLRQIMQKIVNTAEKCGEIPTAEVDVRILTLPFDLLRYEILITGTAPSEQTMQDIVDKLFLPLIHYSTV